ncbi:hypothetical protein HO173_008005 [Letharia columbiana]|uniref:Uncharacterized protein n=1 Tax=Letharia columbiana TaxID=112416 RepID=A0A8H6FS82_9LECA|nr:uncharacterized protein HO173_008005 [Letharia columbiana]KAF6233793.1 hypothetical protein HO173_008005 [Letharia columbiana]
MLSRKKRSHPSALLASAAIFLVSTSTANPTSLRSNSRHTESADLISATAVDHSVRTSIQTHVHERSDTTTLPPRPLPQEPYRRWLEHHLQRPGSLFPLLQHRRGHLGHVRLRPQHPWCPHAQPVPNITPAKVLSLTHGGLRLAFHAAERAVPWGAADSFLRGMVDLTRAGLTGLDTAAFYDLQGSILWSRVAIGLILLPYVKEGVAQNKIA